MAELSIPIALSVVLCFSGLARFYGTNNGRLLVDGILLRTPVIGSVLRKIAISRFARTLSTLMISGIPILESLEIAAGTAGNKVIDQAILGAKRAVEEGKKLAEPLQECGVFPAMVTQIIGVGEQTGRLDQMLEKLAEYYEEESDAAIKNMLTLLEPTMIVFLGVVIGGIVISMYLPIFTLIGRLARGV
jgi:type IV pilus assembly protein PilC